MRSNDDARDALYAGAFFTLICLSGIVGFFVRFMMEWAEKPTPAGLGLLVGTGMAAATIGALAIIFILNIIRFHRNG